MASFDALSFQSNIQVCDLTCTLPSTEYCRGERAHAGLARGGANRKDGQEHTMGRSPPTYATPGPLESQEGHQHEFSVGALLKIHEGPGRRRVPHRQVLPSLMACSSSDKSPEPGPGTWPSRGLAAKRMCGAKACSQRLTYECKQWARYPDCISDTSCTIDSSDDPESQPSSRLASLQSSGHGQQLCGRSSGLGTCSEAVAHLLSNCVQQAIRLRVHIAQLPCLRSRTLQRSCV